MESCAQCGLPHERSGHATCSSHRTNGLRCLRYPLDGAKVCVKHGAGSPQVRRRAARVVAERDARSILNRLGAPNPIGHPVDELLAIAAECRAWLGILREMVSEIHSFTTTDEHEVQRAAAVVELYERALDRTHKILADMVRLDLESRRQQIDEAEAKVLFTAVNLAVSKSELTQEQSERFFRELAGALRTQSVGSPGGPAGPTPEPLPH